MRRLLQGRLIFCPLSLEATLGGDLFNNWLSKMPSAPLLFPSDNTKRPNSPETMKLTKLFRVTLTGLLACTFGAYSQQDSTSVEQRVNTILSQMSLADKLSYIGGTGFFDIKPIPDPMLKALINPQIFQTDGPLGVRRNSPGHSVYIRADTRRQLEQRSCSRGGRRHGARHARARIF